MEHNERWLNTLEIGPRLWDSESSDLRRITANSRQRRDLKLQGAPMAKIALIGLDPAAATQIARALDGGFHQIEQKPVTARVGELSDCDVVFANGEGKKYLPLLRGIRAERPGLPFVVVTRIPETSDWLDALEAGATDYCSAPFEPRQMNWLMQSALSARPRMAAA